MLQRGRNLAVRGQGADQPGLDAAVQRLGFRGRAQMGQGRVMQADGQGGVGEGEHGADSFDPDRGDLGEVVQAVEIGHRIAAEQPQRLFVEFRGPRRVTGGRCLPDEPPELEEIVLGVGDGEPVAGPVGNEQVPLRPSRRARVERLAQLAQVGGNQVCGRRCGAPDRFRDRVPVDQGVGGQREHGQDSALLRWPGIERPVTEGDVEFAEHPEPPALRPGPGQIRRQICFRQPERTEQPPRRRRTRPFRAALFDVAHRADTQSRPFGELLLRDSRGPAPCRDQFPEFVHHAFPPPRGPSPQVIMPVVIP